MASPISTDLLDLLAQHGYPLTAQPSSNTTPQQQQQQDAPTSSSSLSLTALLGGVNNVSLPTGPRSLTAPTATAPVPVPPAAAGETKTFDLSELLSRTTSTPAAAAPVTPPSRQVKLNGTQTSLEALLNPPTGDGYPPLPYSRPYPTTPEAPPVTPASAPAPAPATPTTTGASAEAVAEQVIRKLLQPQVMSSLADQLAPLLVSRLAPQLPSSKDVRESFEREFAKQLLPALEKATLTMYSEGVKTMQAAIKTLREDAIKQQNALADEMKEGIGALQTTLRQIREEAKANQDRLETRLAALESKRTEAPASTVASSSSSFSSTAPSSSPSVAAPVAPATVAAPAVAPTAAVAVAPLPLPPREKVPSDVIDYESKLPEGQYLSRGPWGRIPAKGEAEVRLRKSAHTEWLDNMIRSQQFAPALVEILQGEDSYLPLLEVFCLICMPITRALSDCPLAIQLVAIHTLAAGITKSAPFPRRQRLFARAASEAVKGLVTQTMAQPELKAVLPQVADAVRAAAAVPIPVLSGDTQNFAADLNEAATLLLAKHQSTS